MLGWVNYYIVQWFFIRICREKIRVIEKVKLTDACMDQHGVCAPGYKIEEWHPATRWGIMLGPLPTTGWDARDYIFIRKSPRFIWLFTKHGKR